MPHQTLLDRPHRCPHCDPRGYAALESLRLRFSEPTRDIGRCIDAAPFLETFVQGRVSILGFSFEELMLLRELLNAKALSIDELLELLR